MKTRIPAAAFFFFAALAVGGCAGGFGAAGSSAPYAGLESRAVKALSEREAADYLSGAGMSMALAAELNGYPGPRHVLELAKELELSDAQIARTESLFAEMSREAKALGRAIVENEAALDAMFAEKRADESRLRETVREIARLKGDLRITHLKHHLRTIPILTPEQIRRYDELRGYHSGRHHAH